MDELFEGIYEWEAEALSDVVVDIDEILFDEAPGVVDDYAELNFDRNG